MSEVTVDDIQPLVSEKAKLAIADLVLAWARLDTMVTQWVILAFGMCTDSGPILLGNMDTRTKLERLRTLCAHHGQTAAEQSITNLHKRHGQFVTIRNHVAHSMLAGQRISDPDALVFSIFKPSSGNIDTVYLATVKMEGIRRATLFALDAGDKLRGGANFLLARPSRKPTELAEFPMFPPASRETSAENRRQRQPRPPKGERQK